MQELKKIKCFISSSAKDLEKVNKISDFLKEQGIEVITWKSAFFPGLTLVENLQNALAKVDIVIILLPSDTIQNEQANANLLFEIGLIVGMGKPLLTLVEKNSDIRLPTEMASILLLQYEPHKIESSFRNIRNWAAHSLATSI